MQDAPTTLPPLGVGTLVNRSFRLLIAHFGFLFPLAFVPALAGAFVGQFTGEPMSPGFDPATDPMPIPGPGAVIGLVLNIAISFLVTGVMCLAALDALLGKRHTIMEYVSQTLRHLGPILVLGVLLYAMAGVGFTLLLVPGLYVMARYLPWVPAIVFENAGWKGLTRAQELTAGYRWPLVGAVVLMGLVIVAMILFLSPLALMGGGGLVTVLFEGVISGLYYALLAIFTALIYARLREIKEGMTTADIAATID